EGLGMAAPPLRQVGQVTVSMGLPGLVASLGGQVEGVAQLFVGVVEAAQSGIGASKVPVGADLHKQVGQSLGGSQGGALGGDEVVPVPPPAQEADEGPGQLPGVGVKSGSGDVIYSG